MRRTAIVIFGVLSVLVAAAAASASSGYHRAAQKCVPRGVRLVFADSQADVYGVQSGEVLNIRGCADGQRRSYLIASCSRQESAAACAEEPHVTIAGPVVAYEEFRTTANRYTLPGEATTSVWRVIVRDLRTGRVLHDVPTGTPLKPEPRYVGVGNVVALLVKSDGSVAWVADDYERSSVPSGTGVPFFDVYAVDRAGTRLLASGRNVDPSSLALSVGGTNIGYHSEAVAGSTLYWTQGGQVFSTTLD